MKSYSNEIPNVSTDEIKRSAKVADNTNEMVNETNKIVGFNNKMVRESEINAEAYRISSDVHFHKIRAQNALNTLLLVITLGVSSVALFLALLPHLTG